MSEQTKFCTNYFINFRTSDFQGGMDSEKLLLQNGSPSKPRNSFVGLGVFGGRVMGVCISLDFCFDPQWVRPGIPGGPKNRGGFSFSFLHFQFFIFRFFPWPSTGPERAVGEWGLAGPTVHPTRRGGGVYQP